MPASRLLPALLSALALLLAACGGEENGKNDFVAKADDICRRFNEKARGISRPESVAGLKRSADEAKAIAQEARDELRKLNPPDELKEDFDTFIAQGEKGIAELENLKRAAGKRDADELRRVAARIDELDRRQDAAAARIGFEVCGKD